MWFWFGIWNWPGTNGCAVLGLRFGCGCEVLCCAGFLADDEDCSGVDSNDDDDDNADAEAFSSFLEVSLDAESLEEASLDSLEDCGRLLLEPADFLFLSLDLLLVLLAFFFALEFFLGLDGDGRTTAALKGTHFSLEDTLTKCCGCCFFALASLAGGTSFGDGQCLESTVSLATLELDLDELSPHAFTTGTGAGDKFSRFGCSSFLEPLAALAFGFGDGEGEGDGSEASAAEPAALAPASPASESAPVEVSAAPAVAAAAAESVTGLAASSRAEAVDGEPVTAVA